MPIAALGPSAVNTPKACASHELARQHVRQHERGRCNAISGSAGFLESTCLNLSWCGLMTEAVALGESRWIQ